MDRTDKLIQIKEPCHENWNKMTQSEKGRFCQSCQKEVVDFTNSSRNEILEHLNTTSESTCGRLYAHQLDEQPVDCNTTSPSKSKFIYKLKSVGLSFMAFLGFSLVTDDTNAQVVGRMPINGGVSYMEHENNVAAEKTVISGSVKESHGQAAIARANVTIESGGKMIADAFTNDQGKYLITVPSEKIVNKKFTITAYADEFEPVVMREMPVDKAHITCNLSMEWGVMIMGDVMMPEEELQLINGTPQEELSEQANLVETIKEYPAIAGQITVLNCSEIRESEKELEAETEPQPTNPIAGFLSALPQGSEEEVELEPNPSVAVEAQETELKETEEVDPYEPDGEGEAVIEPHPPVAVEETEPEVEEVQETEPVEPEIEELTEAATSLEENTTEPMTATVFPNPTTDECKIELAQSGSYKIEVFDNAGRHVASEQLDGANVTLDVSKFERGVYHIRILGTQDDYAQTLELIVQ